MSVQVFVFVAAEYETPQNALNQVSFFMYRWCDIANMTRAFIHSLQKMNAGNYFEQHFRREDCIQCVVLHL